MPKLVPPIPPPMTVPDEWCQCWGEVVTKVQAAKIINRSPSIVYKLVEEKRIKTAADGRVLTRSIAEYMLGGAPEPRPKVRKFIK